MNRLAERIADSELEVMRVLWDAKTALPVADIRKAICEKTGWEGSTAKTLLYRLQSKGVVMQEKRDVYYYSPCVTEDEYNEYMTQSLLDKLYKGSAKNLIASFVSSKKLSDDDIAELRNMFRGSKKHE
jgi:BlaI family penicillinase repressor